jgi:hypothetical protein
MAFDLTWKVEIADCAGSIDVTSYVFDGHIDMYAPIGQAGRSNAQITINNQSGIFTPLGSGTYANVNWFAKALVVRASSATTGQNNIVYSGLITDFTVNNESIYQSSVVIVANDFLTIAGRTTSSGYPLLTFYTDAADMINNMIPGGPEPAFPFSTYFYAIQTPKVGGTSSSRISLTSASEVTALLNKSFLDTGRVADWINNQIMPSLPGTIYMDGYTNTSTTWTWEGQVIDRSLNRVDAGQRNFVMVDKSATSGQIPYSVLDVNFALEVLSNDATCSYPSGSYSVQKTDTDSADSYGIRSRNYSTMMNLSSSSIDNVANYWAFRYSIPRYIPAQVGTSYAVLRGNAVDDGAALTKFIDLLTARTALWNQISIVYQLAGMETSQTALVVANRRRISFNPSDTTIQLDVVAGIDNQSFILDSTTYGILGGDGVVYDQPEISYNEFEWTYDDSFVEQGNRLG